MRHKLLVLPVKKLLKSVHIYGSYRKIKTGVPFVLEHPVYLLYWLQEIIANAKVCARQPRTSKTDF